jgi:uncharacterized membrane protein HdeD (DUF308 family)
VLSILAGLIVLIYPGVSLLTLSSVLGIWLLIYGVMEITAAFRLRRLAHLGLPPRGPRPLMAVRNA